jgi:outer membrane protein assembly factor BamB
MLKKTSLFQVTIVLVALSATVSAVSLRGPELQEWTHVGFDAQKTGFNPNEATIGSRNVGSLRVVWANSVPCTINTGVSVANGIVYYGHYCGDFLAVRADTGSIVWSRAILDTHTNQAVVGGVVYVSSRCTYMDCGMVYAFDAQTGATRWTWNPGNRHVSVEAVIGGAVYVTTNGASGDSVHALDAATGVEIWNVSPGGGLAVEGGAVYRSSFWRTPNTLQALSTTDGSLLWTAQTRGQELSRPAVANGVVYVHSDSGELFAFDVRGCGQPVCPPLWTGVNMTAAAGPQSPAVGEGKVYTGAGSTMYAFDASGCGAPSCAPVWTANTACAFFADRPSVANGVVYTACGNSYLYAFDAATGATLWQFYTAGTGYEMRAAPAIVDGMLFHPATFSFELYALAVGAAILPYGCGVNPARSMTAIAGDPVFGSAVYLGLDNPLGTQARGSATYLVISALPDSGFPCGTSLPGFGMGGPGAAGELLVDPQSLLILVGAAWLGPGTPAPVALPIPRLPAIVGASVFAQGIIIDTSPGANVVFGLTDAVELQIGSG